MNSSIVRRAKAHRRLGFVVMLAGLAPVLFVLAQSILVSAGTHRAPELLPEFQGWPALAAIPGQMQLWIVIALLGFAVMMLGAGIVRRALPVLAAAERDRADGLRRAAQYYDGERIEPYIGPGLPGGALMIRDEER